MSTLARSDHERLTVWQRAMDLLVESYRIARMLPSDERYGLASQLRRAALSVPSNIAEGSGRAGPRERLRFLAIARGSLSELRTLIAAVERLGYARDRDLAKARDLCDHTGRLLNGLRRYVANRQRVVTSP